MKRYGTDFPWCYWWAKVAIAIAWCLAIVLLAGCRSERVVTVPETHYHVAHQRDTLTRTDSIYILDSVLTERRADTLYITRTRVEWRDRWRERVRVDSVVRRDSVPYLVEVPARLTRWQRWSLRTGNVVLRLLGLSAAAGGLWLIAWLLAQLLRRHLMQ